MRISALSDESGVAIASIKYYIREGLLPAGERSGHNTVSYSDRHVRRLRLIRALREIGDLPIDSIRAILDAADDPALSEHRVLGVIARSLSPRSVEEVIDAGRAVGHDDIDALLPAYRRAAAQLAELEIAWLSTPQPFDGAEPDVVAERSVVGTVLGDALLTAARREAQRTASAEARRDQRDQRDQRHPDEENIG